MRGHVRKRGRTWSIVFDACIDDGGRRRQQWRGGFATKREAERELAKALRELQTGDYVAPSDQTFGDFLVGEWLPAIRGTVRATTLRSYEMHVRVHIRPRIGQVALQKLNGARLNAFYAELGSSGSSRREGGLSPATVRRVHAVVHRALRDAVRWDRLGRNPADQADPPRQRAASKPEMATWSATEVQRFLGHAAGDRLYAMWVVLLTTGMRRGEVAGLRWTDVDLSARRIAVRQTRVAVGYDVKVAEPKTGRSRRTVALDAGTVGVLRAHRRRQAEERLLAGDSWVDAGLVFVAPNGEPLHPDRMSKLFDQLVRATGLPRIRLHDCRHTYATLALQAGVHPKVVSDRLGHSSTTVTLDTYSHVVPALQEEAAAVVASLFMPGGGRSTGSGDTD